MINDNNIFLNQFYFSILCARALFNNSSLGLRKAIKKQFLELKRNPITNYYYSSHFDFKNAFHCSKPFMPTGISIYLPILPNWV